MPVVVRFWSPALAAASPLAGHTQLWHGQETMQSQQATRANHSSHNCGSWELVACGPTAHLRGASLHAAVHGLEEEGRGTGPGWAQGAPHSHAHQQRKRQELVGHKLPHRCARPSLAVPGPPVAGARSRQGFPRQGPPPLRLHRVLGIAMRGRQVRYLGGDQRHSCRSPAVVWSRRLKAL